MPTDPHDIFETSDIVDFFLSWDSHRATVVKMSMSDELSAEQKVTLYWIVQMIDRISLDDLTSK